MKTTQRHALAAMLLTLGLAACGKGDAGKDEAGAAEKKAHEEGIAALKQPVALISAYLPYTRYPDFNVKYTPKRRSDIEKSTIFAANEIRYAANKARQQLETSSASATKDIQAALKTVTTSCSDANEPETLAKCDAAVKALDGALEKASAAAAALGASAKYPRVAPESVTPEAQAAIAPYLKARGPSANDKLYAEKRASPGASLADVTAACQAAARDAGDAADAFEKSEEALRLVAVTHKMAAESNCRMLDSTEALRKDLDGCRKKAKSTECKIVCGKVKNAIDEGLPAAVFAPMEKDYADICEKK